VYVFNCRRMGKRIHTTPNNDNYLTKQPLNHFRIYIHVCLIGSTIFTWHWESQGLGPRDLSWLCRSLQVRVRLCDSVMKT
jgi:hypothetical protein